MNKFQLNYFYYFHHYYNYYKPLTSSKLLLHFILYYDQQMRNNRGLTGKNLQQLQKHQAKELIVHLLVVIQNNKRSTVHALKLKKNTIITSYNTKIKIIKSYFHLLRQFCPSCSCKLCFKVVVTSRKLLLDGRWSHGFIAPRPL
jgi:hypothetical protein